MGPSLTPSTFYDAAAGKWATTQTAPVGAVSLTTITFISAAVAALPANIGVRTRHQHLCSLLWASHPPSSACLHRWGRGC